MVAMPLACLRGVGNSTVIAVRPARQGLATAASLPLPNTSAIQQMARTAIFQMGRGRAPNALCLAVRGPQTLS